MAIVSHTFTSTDWVPLGTPAQRIVIKNSGGASVQIYSASTNTPPTDTISLFDVTEIGGIAGEYVGLANTYIWARCSKVSTVVKIRNYGEIDPEADIASLGLALTELTTRFNTHNTNKTNIHEVTKTQVGLSKITNALSTDDGADATSMVVKASLDAVDTKILNHIADRGNVHGLTKAQLGLPLTPNAAFATSEEAVDKNNDTTIMSPKTTYDAISTHTEVAFSVPPQCIVAGNMGTRPSGWDYSQCDAPTNLITKDANNTNKIVVSAGLQVSYAYANKSRISTVLGTALSGTIPADNIASTLYVYVDISSANIISSVGVTPNKPDVTTRKEASISDTFLHHISVMLSADGTEIRRVYIGKLLMSGMTISKIISCPLGNRHILPMTTTVAMNNRYLEMSPFIEPIHVEAEVYYNNAFGSTGWNDQIGVKASPYPEDPINKIVVQSGLMGTLASGQESGSSFGLSFTTVNTPLKTRLVLSKQYNH